MVFDGKSSIKWSVDQRMELIEFGLQTEECVNHNDLIRQCGTSKKTNRTRPCSVSETGAQEHKSYLSVRHVKLPHVFLSSFWSKISCLFLPGIGLTVRKALL